MAANRFLAQGAQLNQAVSWANGPHATPSEENLRWAFQAAETSLSYRLLLGIESFIVISRIDRAVSGSSVKPLTLCSFSDCERLFFLFPVSGRFVGIVGFVRQTRAPRAAHRAAALCQAAPASSSRSMCGRSRRLSKLQCVRKASVVT
jgi:hypothetical protein